MKCTNCGISILPTDKFCRECGEQNNNEHINQYNYSKTYSNANKPIYSSNHENQFNYSYKYSNTTKPDYNMNASHADQYDYNYKFSYDPSKYEYASTYKPTSDDKYIQAYVGNNYNFIKNGKFSLPALIFGIYYLLFRKVWGYATLLLLINLSANILLSEDLAGIFSIIINIYIAFKFNELYMKKAENHVEKIKQENLDKTTDELLAICKKKGGSSFASIVMYFAGCIILTIIVFTIFITSGIISKSEHDNQSTKNNHQQETNYKITYTLPTGFTLNYSNNTNKNYIYQDPNTLSNCYISIHIKEITYQNEEEYLKKNVITSEPNKTISSPIPISYNNRTWKYSHLESESRSETQYITTVENKYYVIRTHDIKQNNQTNTICNEKYNEFMNTVIITEY